MIFTKNDTKKLLIKAIIGFTVWVIGTILIFKENITIGLGTTLITLSIYNDLKLIIKYRTPNTQ